MIETIPENLVPREAAAIRRTTTGHLANERHRGVGPPYIKDRGKILYPRDALMKYLAERIVDPSRRAG
jgi:hypothetical protein